MYGSCADYAGACALKGSHQVFVANHPPLTKTLGLGLARGHEAILAAIFFKYGGLRMPT